MQMQIYLSIGSFVLGLIAGIIIMRWWYGTKKTTETFANETAEEIKLSKSEKELFEDLKNEKLSDKQVDKLIELGTITDQLMDKFMQKAMVEVKEKFEYPIEDSLGKSLAKVKNEGKMDEPVVKPKAEIIEDDIPVTKPKAKPEIIEDEPVVKPKSDTPTVPVVKPKAETSSAIKVKDITKPPLEGFSDYEPATYASCH